MAIDKNGIINRLHEISPNAKTSDVSRDISLTYLRISVRNDEVLRLKLYEHLKF